MLLGFVGLEYELLKSTWDLQNLVALRVQNLPINVKQKIDPSKMWL